MKHKSSTIVKEAIFCFIIFLLSITINAQKFDYTWPMGYDDGPVGLGWGLSQMNFNNKLEISYLYGKKGLELGYGGSFINNKEGNLILITDGCSVMDKAANIIKNGENINPGRTYDNYCKGINKYYPVINGNFFITSNSWNNANILIHQSGDPNNELLDVTSEKVYYSKIILNTQGNYEVVLKNEIINTNFAMIVSITALEHPDGDKWWICYREYNSNKFHFVLMGVDGIIKRDSQNIGPIMHKSSDGFSYQTKFSPDGKTYISGVRGVGLLQFDFDRNNAKLSKMKVIHTTNDSGFVRGICFSPDNRLLYFSQDTNLFQYDLKDSSLLNTPIIVGHVDKRTKTDWPYSLGCMHLGPDCRIYVSPGSTVENMHVIHHPNSKGLACEFEVNAIVMPTRLAWSVPNLMTFRTTGNQKLCDSTIQFITSTVNIHDSNNKLFIYPNPVSDKLFIQFRSEARSILTLSLIDGKGNKIRNEKLKVGDNNIDVHDLMSGMYYLLIYERSKILAQGEFLKY
ncbi:MAG: T9SS type A sorting domain-containing protein [Saprospiraceae bacterium]|jgi:hypothetical protein|nr:T9SS type A sorting domain-containing protein [Saprospiraceae bacterium]